MTRKIRIGIPFSFEETISLKQWKEFKRLKKHISLEVAKKYVEEELMVPHAWKTKLENLIDQVHQTYSQRPVGLLTVMENEAFILKLVSDLGLQKRDIFHMLGKMMALWPLTKLDENFKED